MRRTTSQRGTLALAICVAASAVTTNGCSMLFVDAPPENHRSLKTFNCTTSNNFPTADLVIAGVLGLTAAETLAAGTAASQTTDYQTGQTTQQSNTGVYVGAGITAAAAAAFVASAVVGYRRTSECKDATGELMIRLYPSPSAPMYAPYPYAPPPPSRPYDPWNAPAQGGAPQYPPPGAPGQWGPAPTPTPAPYGAPAAPPPAAPAPGPARNQF
jgi:hypothetical protein